MPVPDIGTFCGAPDASSWTTKFPICRVVSGGVKVTNTLQVFPGANILMHMLLILNGAASVVSPVIVTWFLEILELMFLIVTFFTFLVLPTYSLFLNTTS